MCYQLIGNNYLKPSLAYHGSNTTTTTIIIQYHTVFAGKPVKVAAVSDYALHIKLAAMELNDSVLQGTLFVHKSIHTSDIISSRYLLHRVRCVELHGTHYTRMAVVVYKHIDDTPVFGEIMDIFVTPVGECLFILRLLLTVGLCAHFHSYEVAYSSNIVVSRQHEFVDHYPLHIVKLHSELAGFIRLKYHYLQ